MLSLDQPDSGDIDRGLAKLVAVGITVPVFLVSVAICVTVVVIYKRRLSAIESSDEATPILEDQATSNRLTHFVLPCQGRLRFWQRIPSPNLSSRSEHQDVEE